ncbi:hypothetical protein PR048_030534 [Dryococelus australis]|uniref:DDE-1 domain-containing protein n=1 Tax=Dryococelus australis TaxID=614101 RepID=A0ABQ9G985_9NEOP|nr:hypothetical protein PR048_030534 [Dryococelus australis]
MQELGFGLTVNQIRHLAYKSAEQSGSEHPFKKTKEMAGWFWWANFKSCYGFTLSQAENLALYRASTANREILNDFYTELENLDESLQVTFASHASHLSPHILELAAKNDVHIGNFPSHTTHPLQPLDVGLYKPFKSNWKKELDAFMHSHPGAKPSRVDFYSLRTPIWLSTFIPQTIINSFRKTGIFSIDRCAITDQAIASSLVTDQPQAHKQSTNDGNTTYKPIFQLPHN